MNIHSEVQPSKGPWTRAIVGSRPRREFFEAVGQRGVERVEEKLYQEGVLPVLWLLHERRLPIKSNHTVVAILKF